MYTTKSWMKGVLVLSLVAVLSGYGSAAGRLDDRTTMSDQPSWEWGVAPQDTPRPQSDMSGTQVGVNLHRATKLRGSPIRNFKGEKLGSVHDLVLTPDLEEVSYAVVSTGGIFGIGRQLHAIPWSAVQTGIGGNIVVPISEQEFAQDRGFTDCPAEGNPRWLSRPGERTEEVTFGLRTGADRESIQNRRFSRIKGMKVRGPEDQGIGTLQDFVVATDTGAVAYTIVSFGSFLGLNPQYAAIPTHAVDFEPERRIARVSVDRQALQAYAFSPGAFPNLSDSLYARQLNRAYGLEGYDTVLGYVPAEERPTAERPMIPTTPMAAPTEAELTGKFDPAQIRTIEGTVTDLGKYKCSKTGMDMLWLRVRTDDGQSVAVNAGPRKYVAGQDFYAVRGDRIRLTGSRVSAEAAGKYVFLPTEVAIGENVLRLRDPSGRMLWESESPEHREHEPDAPDHT